MPHFQVTMPGHDRRRSLGTLATYWIEHFYRHGDGDMRGKRYTVEEDYFHFLVDAYALREDGRRLYNLVVLSRAKGNAKTALAAAIALFEALGPCRFSGYAKGGEVYEWLDFRYEYKAGEPMGAPIVDPIVRIMATEETQTGNTFGNVMANLYEDEANADDPSPLVDWIRSRKDVYAASKAGMKLPAGGRILLSTGGSKSKDGGKESFAVADETHLYTHGLVDMFTTVSRNLPKRLAADPWMLATTTMYADGQGSIGEMHHKTAIAISTGKAKRNSGTLFDHLEGHPVDDLEDEEALEASLREAYAGREWINYEGFIAKAFDPVTKPEDFRRYYLNTVASSSTAFLTSAELASVQGTDEHPVKPLAPGDIITLGFDYAPGNRGEGRKGKLDKDGNRSKAPQRKFRVPDATALIACRLSDMSLHPVGIWEPDEAAALREGWNPPTALIEQTVHDCFERYTVVGMYADPSGVEAYLDRWTQRYHDRLKVKASTSRPMYRYMSGLSAASMARDIEQFYQAVASQQVLMYPDLTFMQHFTNTRRITKPTGVSLHKRNTDSAEKIDAAVAAVLAFICAVHALNKGVQTEAEELGYFQRLY